MAQIARQVNVSDLPPATNIFNNDVFMIDQVGGDGYTKKLSYTTLSVAISTLVTAPLVAMKLNRGGDTMTGPLYLSESPVVNLQAATKQYVDQNITSSINALSSTIQTQYFHVTGGTLSGPLILTQTPTQNMEAATKQYVDQNIGVGIYAVPTGAIIWYCSTQAPAGYLVCNGDIIPNGPGTVQGATADFSVLYSLLGSFGGPGELPDLRGEVVRGWSQAGGAQRTTVDVGRVFGSNQAAQVGQHSLPVRTTTGTTAAAQAAWSSRSAFAPGYTIQGELSDSFVNTVAYTGDRRTNDNIVLSNVETRVRNIALLPCIKY